MAKTSTQRSRERRERLKKDPAVYKNYLEEDKNRKKLERNTKQQSLSPREFKQYRAKENARIQSLRDLKRLATKTKTVDHEKDQVQVSSKVFGSKQSMGRALKSDQEITILTKKAKVNCL